MNNLYCGLLILDCGGHARSMADVALKAGYTDLLFVDSKAKPNETLLGFSILRDLPEHLPTSWACIPGSGDGKRRKQQIEGLEARGWPITTLISPMASISPYCDIGRGSVIAHHAHVGPLAHIGEGCIVNTSAIVEHDCRVGDYTHVSVHATLAGACSVGSFCMIGAGATMIDRVSVTDQVCIGAGAAVIASIDLPGTYVGVPAKLVPHTKTPSHPS